MLRIIKTILIFFTFTSFPAIGQESSPPILEGGRIISYELEGIMTPSQIDTFNEELFKGYEAPQAQYSVAVYWVTYESLYPDGTIAPIKSQVFIPQYTQEGIKSLYAFGPGSTGIRDNCRPSREHILGIRWGLYRSHVLAHAGQGSIGFMPDYMGFGDPDHLQYYMVSLCEARAMLDGIRATKNLLALLDNPHVTGTTNFVAGFSQGGHAAYAAADLRLSYAPEIELQGVIGYGPTTNVTSLFNEFSDVAPMALYTYQNLYGKDKVDPAKILLEKYATNLEGDLLSMCVGGMQNYYSPDPTKLILPDIAQALSEGTLSSVYPSLSEILTLNSPGLGGHGIPSLILQGTDDIVIAWETQEVFVKALKEAGEEVDYYLYKGVRHDTRQFGFSQTRLWIDEKSK